jgi:hypothetical protein
MKPFKTCKYVKIDGFKLPIKHEVWNGDMRWLELLVRSLCTLSRLAPLYDGQGRWLCVGKADSIPPPGECKCFFVLGSTAAKKLSSSRVTPCEVWLIETSSTAAVCIRRVTAMASRWQGEVSATSRQVQHHVFCTRRRVNSTLK